MQRGYPVGKGTQVFLLMKKVQKKETSALRTELENYRKQGVELWLDGRPSTPRTITRAHMIAEEGSYMRDYIQSEDGKVSGIHFNLVRDK